MNRKIRCQCTKHDFASTAHDWCPFCRIDELEARLNVIRKAVQPNDGGPEFICFGDNPEVGEALFKDPYNPEALQEGWK